MLISVLTAWALLAEAAAATALGRPWQLSWWLWHVLLVLAFAFVAYSAHVQYRREGAAGSLFRGVALEDTIIEARAGYEHALEQLVAVMRERQPDEREVTRLTAAVARQFDLTEAQQEVLERAALALERERETTNQLSGLVEVSRATTVLDDEDALLDRAAIELDARFSRDRISLALIHDGRLEPVGDRQPSTLVSELAADAIEQHAPVERDHTLVWPLLVKDEAAGVVAFERQHGSFDDGDRAMASSVAAQLAVQLENTRLYRTIDTLFRRYLAPTVVTRLLADPDQAALGGAVVEVTALFADLRGFTTYSERHDARGRRRAAQPLLRRAGPVPDRARGNGRQLRRRRGDGRLQRADPPGRPCDAGGPRRAGHARRVQRAHAAAIPSSRPSGSASTPAPRSSATSAPSCATTR